MRKIGRWLDILLRGGYFYNREWVRRRKHRDDICMEFEHFLTKDKRYLWIWNKLRKRKNFFDRLRSRWILVYFSDEPPHKKGFCAIEKDEKPYLQRFFRIRGIYATSGCWQEILCSEAFAYGECASDCCFSLYREMEEIYSIGSERYRCQVDEYVYDENFAEVNRSVDYKYLYVAQIETSLMEIEEKLSIRQFIKYIQNIGRRSYIMRTPAPLEAICLPNGRCVKMNEINKEDERCL